MFEIIQSFYYVVMGAIFMFAFIGAILIMGVIVWKEHQKHGGISNITRGGEDPLEKLYSNINNSFWICVGYLIWYPMLCLMLIGAKTYSEINTSATLSLTVFLIIISYASLWPLLTHLLRLCCDIVKVSAVAIDAYVEKTFPLDRYESKRGDRKYVKKIQQQ